MNVLNFILYYSYECVKIYRNWSPTRGEGARLRHLIVPVLQKAPEHYYTIHKPVFSIVVNHACCDRQLPFCIPNQWVEALVPGNLIANISPLNTFSTCRLSQTVIASPLAAARVTLANTCGLPLSLSLSLSPRSFLAFFLNFSSSSSLRSGGHAANPSAVDREFSLSFRIWVVRPVSDVLASTTVSWSSTRMAARFGFPRRREKVFAAVKNMRWIC